MTYLKYDLTRGKTPGKSKNLCNLLCTSSQLLFNLTFEQASSLFYYFNDHVIANCYNK
jgi:hypothetical protein